MTDAAALTMRIRTIAEDHDRGASAIGNDLRRQLVPWKGTPEEGERLARILIGAKPVMSPVLHIANHLLGAEEPPTAAHGLGASGLAIVQPQGRHLEQRDPVVTETVQRVLDATPARPLRAMTYSASGTVESTLDALQEGGHLRRVYLSEAMPAGEGRSLAARLAAEWGPHEAEVVLTHDAALPAILGDVDVLIIGADLVLPHGLVNKVGTSVLIERAERLGVPVVVAAALEKAPPRGVQANHLPLPLATEAGQLRDPPTGVRTIGLAFEWVEMPASFLPAWATDPDVPRARPALIELLAGLRRRPPQAAPGATQAPGGRA